MTDEEIEKLCAEATPGPWRRWRPIGEDLFRVENEEGNTDTASKLLRVNANFIAAARTLVPALLERARRAEAEVTSLVAEVETSTSAEAELWAAARLLVDGRKDMNHLREVLSWPRVEAAKRQAERIRLLEQEVAALTEANGIYKRTAKEVIERQGAEVLALRAKVHDEEQRAAERYSESLGLGQG